MASADKRGHVKEAAAGVLSLLLAPSTVLAQSRFPILDKFLFVIRPQNPNCFLCSSQTWGKGSMKSARVRFAG